MALAVPLAPCPAPPSFALSMRALALRSCASTRSMQAGAVVRSRLGRVLDDIVGGLGQAVDDLAGGVLNAAGTALKGNVVGGLPGMHPAAPPASPTRGGNGAPSASRGGTSTHPGPPRSTDTPPASGGDETPDPPLPAHPQAPQSPSAFPSAPTLLSSGTPDGASAAASPPTSTRPPGAAKTFIPSPLLASADDAQTRDGAPLFPWNTASSTHASSPTGALAGGGGAHGKGFPLAAAAALGCVLGLLVLCAAVWFYRSRRRRRARRAHLHPKRAMSLISATTVSTVPLFISAREAGVADENPFRHPRDADTDEDDPFHSRASWWSMSTRRSASTISV